MHFSCQRVITTAADVDCVVVLVAAASAGVVGAKAPLLLCLLISASCVFVGVNCNYDDD